MGKNLAIMKEFLERFQTDPRDACDLYLREDFECHEPPGLPQGGIFKGKDAPIRISSIYSGIWDVSYDLDSLECWEPEDGDIVFSRYEITWTSRETGKSLSQPIAEINTFEDGKIRKMEVFHFDAIGLAETLGT